MLSIVDRIAGALGYARKTATVASAPEWLLADAAMARWSLPDLGRVEGQADLYRRLSWVQIAVSAVGRTAAAATFSVHRRVGEELRDIPNHAFELLLARPNPLDSRFELLEHTFNMRRLTGNAYWWLNRRDERSAPVEIWPIPPHQIQPIPDGRQYLRGYGFYPEGISGSVTISSPPFLLEPWEVVHFKTFNPISRFVGLSPLEALAIDAQGDLRMQEWNLNFFGENNAKMPGMLAFADPIPDPDWERIKSDVRRETGGVRRALMMIRNAGKGGVNWVQMAMSQKEMEFLLARQFTKEEIFTTFAPGLVSVLDANATEANATAGKNTFLDQAVWPDMVAAGEKITNDVLPIYGRNLVGGFDDIRATDRELELREQEAFERVHTIDEVRKKYYQADPIGDERGKLLVAQIGPGSAAPAPPREPPATPDRPAPPEPAPDAPPAPAAPDPEDDQADDPPAPPRQQAAKRGAGEDLSDDELALYELLRPIFARHGEEIAVAIQVGQTISYDALSEELRNALLSAAVAVALSAFQVMAADLGEDFEPDEVVTRASQWAEQYSYDQVAGLTAYTQKVVSQAVTLFERTPGMTRGQLETLLSPAFGAMRAELIAVTETTRAAAAGVTQLQEALGGRGIPMERIWRTNADEPDCAVCPPLNGKPESEWPAELRAGPPAHPRCRCSVTLMRRRG